MDLHYVTCISLNMNMGRFYSIKNTVYFVYNHKQTIKSVINKPLDSEFSYFVSFF